MRATVVVCHLLLKGDKINYYRILNNIETQQENTKENTS